MIEALRELNPLWEIDLEGAALGAVVDTFSKDHSRRLQLPVHLKASKSDVNSVTSACEYFNAGVLLVDLPAVEARTNL